MTRRRIVLVALLAGALLAALMPWTVRSDQVIAALARQIRQGYGVTLVSGGSLTLTLLPLPQLELSGVRLGSADGVVDAEAGTLRTQLRLLPLFQGQLRLHKVWLAAGQITVTLTQEPIPTVAGTLSRLRARLGSGPDSRWVPRIDRFVVTDCEVAVRDRAGRHIARLSDAALVLNSPEPDGDIDVTASARWNGESVIASMSGLNLAAIRDGRPNAVEGEFAAKLARATISGRLTWSDRPAFEGALRAQATSLARFTEWSGLGSDVSAIERPGSLAADGSIDLDRIELPRATLEIGRDALEGAMAVQFGERPQLRGTFAAGDLDLGWLGTVVGSRRPDRTRADYDIRLSARSVTLWALKLRDAGLSLQSGARGTELSLGRAGFAGGTLRGRLSTTPDEERQETRVLAWADGIDLERALGELTGFRGLSGVASGQLSLDLAGDGNRSLEKRLRGRAFVKARDGEVASLAVADAVKRTQSGPSSDWRGGKARFSQLGFVVDVADGSAELGDAVVETGATRGLLSGRIDLETLKARLRLSLQPQPAQPGRPPVVVDLAGPLARLDPVGEGEANAQR